jgi:hypothetical protein
VGILIIKECIGYELEKAQSNTSEDFFNRSEVTFLEDGEERTFHLLYVRFFDELRAEVTPFKEDPLFTIGEREIYFRDIVALICLIKNPGFRNRKRVYINSQEEMASYFEGFQFEKLPEIFEMISTKNSYKLESPLNFTK